MSVDDRILATVRGNTAYGCTSLDVENQLRPELGSRTHQTVTGNTRHLVERGRLIIIAPRFQAGCYRHVYIASEFYSYERHGPMVHVPHNPRCQLTENEIQAYRRKFANAGTNSILKRIYTVIAASSYGLTCREIEYHLQLPHQTASARLAELHGARLITKCGRRRLLGEPRPQPIYRVVSQDPPRQPTLFN